MTAGCPCFGPFEFSVGASAQTGDVVQTRVAQKAAENSWRRTARVGLLSLREPHGNIRFSPCPLSCRIMRRHKRLCKRKKLPS